MHEGVGGVPVVCVHGWPENHVGTFFLRECGHFVPWEAPHALVSGVRMLAADLLAARRSGPVSRG